MEKKGKNKFQSSGFFLPLAVLITSIVLSMSFTIFILVSHSVKFSALGRDSQIAFYAADGGVECALFWDIKFNAFDPTNPRGTVDCAEKEDVPVVESPTGVFSFSLTGLPNGSCAEVEIDKSEFPVTVVRSWGHNTCVSGRADRVERALEVSYSDFRSVDINSDLIGYWRFDEGTGTIVSGSNNGYLGMGSDHVTTDPESIPIWRSGADCVSGSCLEFERISDTEGDFVRIFDADELDPSPDFTIQVWAKFHNVAGGEQAIFSKCEDYASYALRLNHSPGEEKVGIKLEAGVHNQHILKSTNTVENNRWYSVAAVREGSSLRLYLDNNTPDILEDVSMDMNPNTHDLFIGGDPRDPSPGELNYAFDGLIDEVRFYGRALNQNEINTLYNLGQQ